MGERPVHDPAHRAESRGPVGGDESEAGAAVEHVLLVERSLVARGSQQLGTGDRTPGRHRPAQPGIPRGERGEEIRIEADREIPYGADGEAGALLPVTVRGLPGVLRVLYRPRDRTGRHTRYSPAPGARPRDDGPPVHDTEAAARRAVT
ncbi:hypothetical protein ACH5AO_14675 [Streptomyces sp. NPDC018964]|uniref:hypothetical protein n=1 Tax=unclassified Streptomyces TaxID=2593676 RepID=UPI0037BB6706